LWNIKLLNVTWSLKNIDIQATADVPCDVAMHWPDTRVVLVPLKNDVAWSAVGKTGLHKLNITTLGIGCVDDSAIPLTKTLSENMEIVTVKMLKLG
jgi:hypothetical protein